MEAKKASPSGRAQAIEAIEKQPLVIPNLWSSILQNLNELELKSKSSESKSSEEDEDDDETEDEDDESKESDDESKETKESDKESDNESKQSTASFGFTEKCEYCGKDTRPEDELKSVIMKDGKPQIIKFCSVKCFENKEDWPKIKKQKRVKREKKSRKSKKERKNKK